MKDPRHKTKKGWYIHDDSLDQLTYIKNQKNNALLISGNVEKSEVDYLEEAIEILYSRVSANAKDRETASRISNMVDDNIDAKTSNLENIELENNRMLNKIWKYFDLFMMATLNDLDGIAKKNADLFKGDVAKTKEFYKNMFVKLLEGESEIADLIEQHILKVESGEFKYEEPDDEIKQ